MKSYIAYAEAIYGGIIEDASTCWPNARISLEKDLSYLRRAVEQRGLSFLTITLPSYGKVIDRSLDQGIFLADEIPQGIPHRKRRPILFRDLHMKIFDDSGLLRPDACVTAVFFLRTLLYAMKKLRLQCDASKVKDTLDEFFSIEERLPPSHPNTWDAESPVWARRDGHPLWGDVYRDEDQQKFSFLPDRDFAGLPWSTLRNLCRRIISEFGTPNWWELEPKHGPGVVSEQQGFISKYEFPHWPKKLGDWFPFDWFGSGSFDPEFTPSDREPPSRLIAVPKTQKGPRLIAAEPTAHQWMQQSIWRWLEGRIESSLLKDTITFRSQENSRNRALHSSIDGSLATIDLSSASDRLCTRLVEYVFQGSPILDGLHACRTRSLIQTISPDHPRMILMRKFAPMGSACTFPIQSIVFSILAIWALRLVDGDEGHFNGLKETCREVTVFGDDIIIPRRGYEAIKLILHECGLKVNTDKSFAGSNFREACGCDAFRGVDVTPAYALGPYDGSPSSMATTIETANNFFHKGYWRTAEIAVNQLPHKEQRLLRVTSGGEGGLGLYSFCGPFSEHLPVKWDQRYQREYRVALSITSKVTKKQGTGLSGLTQYFTEEPDPMFPWRSGQPGPARVRKALVRVYR